MTVVGGDHIKMAVSHIKWLESSPHPHSYKSNECAHSKFEISPLTATAERRWANFDRMELAQKLSIWKSGH